MKCEYCDNDVVAGAQRCPCCGAAIRNVGNTVYVPTPAVPSCHAPQVQLQAVAQLSEDRIVERKSRLAYILLGLFLGAFGIHNFYAGRLNRAVGQLLITVLVGWMIVPLIAVWIWCIVDICAITTDGEGIKFS